MAFEKTEEDTARMFDEFQSCRINYINDMAFMMCSEEIDADEKREVLRKRSLDFFKK